MHSKAPETDTPTSIRTTAHHVVLLVVYTIYILVPPITTVLFAELRYLFKNTVAFARLAAVFLLCFVAPPLAVWFMRKALVAELVVNLQMCFWFWLPGIVHALSVFFAHTEAAALWQDEEDRKGAL